MTVVHARPPADPHAVVLVDLAEGVRLMSNVVGVPADEVRIGMPVRAKIEGNGPDAILLFEPA